MSDLDADLYGDLYANDENEFAVPLQDPDTNGKADAQDDPKDESKHSANPEASQPSKSNAPPREDTNPQGLSPDDSGTSAIPSYTSPTQQIPTYQERQLDYREPAPPRHDSYQGAPGVDRPVRPSEMKEEGKMFIGGLNWDTTDDSLKKYFTQFGKVEACTIMRDAAGRSRCFAFLTFEDPASVNAVMVREHFLDGKIIDPKRAIPRQEHQRATKLFIGGLPGSVTSESMREYFSQFGKVVDATVMLDRETGRSKGFGFVSFENVNVEPMLGFGNLQIDGKLIDVKLAQPRSQREAYAEGPSPGARTGFSPTGASGFVSSVSGGGAYGTQNYSGQSLVGVGGVAGGGAGSPAGAASFDPQALAQLYTRMISQIGGMTPMMGMGMNMNPALMAGGAQYGLAGGMGLGMRGAGAGGMMAGGGGGGMGAGGMGAGGGGMGAGAGAGAGAGGGGGRGMAMASGPGSLGPNVPRGPRNAPTGPAGGVGPQRGQRGQHSYHPYAR